MFLFKFPRWLRRRSITQSSWCLSFPTGTFYNWFCKFKNNRRTFERIGAWGRQQCPNLSAWEQTRIWTINQCNGRKHLHKLLNFVHRVCRLLVAVLTQQRTWIKKNCGVIICYNVWSLRRRRKSLTPTHRATFRSQYRGRLHRYKKCRNLCIRSIGKLRFLLLFRKYEMWNGWNM